MLVDKMETAPIIGDNGEVLVELTSTDSDFGSQISLATCVESDSPLLAGIV